MKMGGKVSRNVSNNEELSRRHAYKVILVASSGVSGGILTKDPHPYPLRKGRGGSTLTMWTRRDIK